MNSKNAKESLKFAGSRLNHLESMGNTAELVFAKFMKRKQEVDELHKYTEKIKKYIDTNKEKLIKDNGELEKRIFEIHVINNQKLRSTIETKLKNNQLPKRSFSTSFLHTENDDDPELSPTSKQVLPG